MSRSGVLVPVNLGILDSSSAAVRLENVFDTDQSCLCRASATACTAPCTPRSHRNSAGGTLPPAVLHDAVPFAETLCPTDVKAV